MTKAYKVGQRVLVEVEITRISGEHVQLYPFVYGLSWTSLHRLREVDRTDTRMTSEAQQIQQLQAELERIQRHIDTLKIK